MDDKPKTKRRWFRFSLRTLLLLVTVASVGFGWFASEMWQAQRQREAVEDFKQLGCYIYYDYELPPASSPRGPTWFRKLAGDDFLANVAMARLTKTSFTDETLVNLNAFPHLKDLSLQYTQVTDAGLVHVQRLTQISYLDLRETKITDHGMVHLEGLTQLQILFLCQTQVTDLGLVHLQGLTQLRSVPNRYAGHR